MGNKAREGFRKGVPAVAKAAVVSGQVGRWRQQQRSKLVPGWPRAEETSLSHSEVLEEGVLKRKAELRPFCSTRDGCPAAHPWTINVEQCNLKTFSFQQMSETRIHLKI